MEWVYQNVERLGFRGLDRLEGRCLAMVLARLGKYRPAMRRELVHPEGRYLAAGLARLSAWELGLRVRRHRKCRRGEHLAMGRMAPDRLVLRGYSTDLAEVNGFRCFGYYLVFQ